LHHAKTGKSSAAQKTYQQFKSTQRVQGQRSRAWVSGHLQCAKKSLSPRYGLLSYMDAHLLTKGRAMSKTLKERISWLKSDDSLIQLGN
jgi:hypothetical protein